MHEFLHTLPRLMPSLLGQVSGELQQVTELPAVAVGSGTLILLITIFVLAVFVGVEIITKIPPTLHTPLMSGSNAISGITVVGAILESGKDGGTASTVLGLIAVVLATVNVVGGFVVTDRMLSMFKSKKK